ncbi:hypothetical protein ACFQ0B_70095 [Nonomuraea thailandensis]
MRREPLTVGVFSPSVLLRAGRRLGLVDAGVREEPVASSPAQFAALLAGELDAALTSPDNAIAHRYVRGDPLDVRIVSAVDRGLGLALYARPGLASAAELKGRVAGVDVPDSGFAFALYAAMEAVGLSRGDYRTVALGATPRRLEALLGGGCAATMLNAGSDLRAEDAGAVRLAGCRDRTWGPCCARWAPPWTARAASPTAAPRTARTASPTASPTAAPRAACGRSRRGCVRPRG